MKTMLKLMMLLAGTFAASCSGMSDLAETGDYIIEISTGSEWLHDFSTFTKTPPQYALWMEDDDGNYLGTVFLTRKIATEGWVFNNGNRRMEALPVWAHKRNEEDDSGVLLPSREQPFVDSVSGATPKGNTQIVLRPETGASDFWLVMEVNQSTDFNSFWPKDAGPEDTGWTGGEGGSGQPSLVYRARIDSAGTGPWTLSLTGHGSPDGSDGYINTDVSSLTTALEILKTVTVRKQL